MMLRRLKWLPFRSLWLLVCWSKFKQVIFLFQLFISFDKLKLAALTIVVPLIWVIKICPIFIRTHYVFHVDLMIHDHVFVYDFQLLLAPHMCKLLWAINIILLYYILRLVDLCWTWVSAGMLLLWIHHNTAFVFPNLEFSWRVSLSCLVRGRIILWAQVSL